MIVLALVVLVVAIVVEVEVAIVFGALFTEATPGRFCGGTGCEEDEAPIPAVPTPGPNPEVEDDDAAAEGKGIGIGGGGIEGLDTPPLIFLIDLEPGITLLARLLLLLFTLRGGLVVEADNSPSSFSESGSLLLFILSGGVPRLMFVLGLGLGFEPGYDDGLIGLLGNEDGPPPPGGRGGGYCLVGGGVISLFAVISVSFALPPLPAPPFPPPAPAFPFLMIPFVGFCPGFGELAP